MENIVKLALEERKNKLHSEYSELESRLIEESTERIKTTLYEISDVFSQFKVDVDSKKINIHFENEWSGIEIRKRDDYYWDFESKGEKVWSNDDVYLDGTSSNNNKSKEDLIFNIALGELSKHLLNKSNEWISICEHMKYIYDYYQSLIKPISMELHQIDRELDKIKQEERDQESEKIFKSGECCFSENVKYHYGNGKRDYYYGNSLKWESNKGGKTMTLSMKNSNGDYVVVGYREKINNVKRFLLINNNKIVK